MVCNMAEDSSGFVMQNCIQAGGISIPYRAIALTVPICSHLLDLLELMDSEDTPSIPSVRTGFLSETRRVTSVPVILMVSFGEFTTSITTVTHLIGNSLGSIRSSACMAEMGCSEVAIRYLSSSSPPTCIQSG